MMKLYYAPGACSLATRICLHEVGLAADFERVDVHSKITENGEDYAVINPKGSVPMVVLDDGQALTENVAILDWLAQREPQLGVTGRLGRTRLIEMLSFLSTEVHIAFKPLFHEASDVEKAEAVEAAARRLDLLSDRVRESGLFGADFTVADAYLFVMLRWANAFHVPMRPQMAGYFERIAERPSVRQALAEEGLAAPQPSALPVA